MERREISGVNRVQQESIMYLQIYGRPLVLEQAPTQVRHALNGYFWVHIVNRLPAIIGAERVGTRSFDHGDSARVHPS